MFRTISYSIPLGLCIVALSLTGCDLGEFNGEIPNPEVQPPPNIEPQLGCSTGCHGGPESSAPPNDNNGNDDPGLVTVGAHRKHLEVAPTWYRKIACAECHVQYTALNDPGHLDDPPAELTFGDIATADNVAATWNGANCTVYCHGTTMQGGETTQPSWTDSGPLDSCVSCHGNPPPPPHPPGADCGGCHPTVEPGGSSVFLDPESHIDGKVDTANDNDGADGCATCHGNPTEGDSAPPNDTLGNSDPTIQTVGAHQAHLGDSDWRRVISCSNCHVVPVNVGDAPHIDGDNQAELVFDALNPSATYDFPTATCGTTYCHGTGYADSGPVPWTTPLDLGCNGCHSDGTDGGGTMSGAHDDHLEENMTCSTCHSEVTNVGGNILAPDLHINGLHEVDMTIGGTWDTAAQTCNNVPCHGGAPIGWGG